MIHILSPLATGSMSTTHTHTHKHLGTRERSTSQARQRPVTEPPVLPRSARRQHSRFARKRPGPGPASRGGAQDPATPSVPPPSLPRRPARASSADRRQQHLPTREANPINPPRAGRSSSTSERTGWVAKKLLLILTEEQEH